MFSVLHLNNNVCLYVSGTLWGLPSGSSLTLLGLWSSENTPLNFRVCRNFSPQICHKDL